MYWGAEVQCWFAGRPLPTPPRLASRLTPSPSRPPHNKDHDNFGHTDGYGPGGEGGPNTDYWSNYNASSPRAGWNQPGTGANYTFYMKVGQRRLAVGLWSDPSVPSIQARNRRPIAPDLLHSTLCDSS